MRLIFGGHKNVITTWNIFTEKKKHKKQMSGLFTLKQSGALFVTRESWYHERESHVKVPGVKKQGDVLKEFEVLCVLRAVTEEDHGRRGSGEGVGARSRRLL